MILLRESTEVDRYKQYLTRTLFQDIPTLSPVYECDEDRLWPLPHQLLYRDGSPLPELIIEVERRINKHDEPEEFYVKLEIMMKRMYCRDFLGIEGSEISSEYESQGSFDYSSQRKFLNDEESFDEEDTHLTLQTENEEMPETERSCTSAEGLSRYNDESLDIKQECVEGEGLAEITDASTNGGLSATNQDQRSPEIMRKRKSDPMDTSIPIRRFDSIDGSIPNDDNLCSGNDLVTEDLEELNEGLNVEGDVDDQFIGNIENIPTCTSSPISSKAQKRKQENTHLPRKRRSVYSYTSNEESIKQFCTQTDFSNDSFCSQEFYNRFFKGTPTIFKLCTCEDHQCF